MKNLSIQKNNPQLGGEASKLGVRLLIVGYLLFVFVPTISFAAAVRNVSNNSLVGYWTFDEGAGTKANDMSGNKNTGTLAGATLPSWVSGKLSKALFFDGVTSKVSLGSLNIPTTVTISAWVKTSTAGQRPILSNRSGGSGVVYFGVTGGNLFVYDNAATPAAMTSNASINTNTWKHVVWTSDGSTSNMYINGVFDKTQAHTRTGGVANGNIGWDQANNVEYFPGYIDDLRVYNRVLTAQEIKTLYQFGTAQIKNVQKSGLVGYWTFDDGAGSKVNDMSGRYITGNLTGTTPPTWVAGKINRGLSFDGSTSSVTLSGSLGVSPNSAFTITHWVKTTSALGQMYTVGNAGGANGYRFGLSGGVMAFLIGDGTSYVESACGTKVVNDGKWHMITGIFDRPNLTFTCYTDGANTATVAIPAFLNQANANNPSFGKPPCCNALNGSMDEVRVYNRALSATEIQQLYKQNATQVNASTNNFLNSGLIYVFSLNGGDINWGSNTAYDRSGQGNNATLVSFSTTSSPATGKLGQALKFNGVSSYVDTPAMAFLGQASATFSISVWVKPRVVGGTIIHNRNDGTGWSTGLIGFHLGKLSYNIYSNGFADSPNTAVAGRWLHVSFTRDGVTGVNKLYENGVLVKTTTTTYSPSGGSHKFTLGRFVADCCQMDSPGWFDGVMDDYRLYNRVLSESEVKQLYNMAR